MKKDIKVVVGLSGGVDSSVAAYLLKEEGYDVIGVTMEIWKDEAREAKGGCCAPSTVDDARAVAEHLGIDYHVLDFKQEFKRDVVDYFVEAYRQGLTPNPCVMCNRKVKWESLLSKSMTIGADYVATGHYAQIVKLDNGRYALKKSKTAEKDQTYALHRLTQDQLARTLMPLGKYEKPEVRKIAEKIGLELASKPDSQDICFIPDGDYVDFLETYTGKEGVEGDFVDLDGKVLGRHKGIANYTIGQRRGLGISAENRLFVVDIDVENNVVVLGSNDDTFSSTLRAKNINLMAVEKIEGKMELTAKVRYKHKPAKCVVWQEDDDTMVVEFEEPQRAITKGQAVVLYDGDVVVGGGIII